MSPKQLCHVCSEPATSFVLQGVEKISTCDTHTSKIPNRRQPTFDIEGFYFIKSLSDFPEFEDRKFKRAFGTSKLEAIQRFCEAELQRGIEAASISPSSQEALDRLTERHQEVTEQLEAIQRKLRNWARFPAIELDAVEDFLISRLDPESVREALRGLAVDIPALLLQNSLEGVHSSPPLALHSIRHGKTTGSDFAGPHFPL